MKTNKTVKKRLEAIKKKGGFNFDVNTLCDCIETILNKNVKDVKCFLDFCINSTPEQYETGKSKFIIRKDYQISADVINARFEKQLKRLYEKYKKQY